MMGFIQGRAFLVQKEQKQKSRWIGPAKNLHTWRFRLKEVVDKKGRSVGDDIQVEIRGEDMIGDIGEGDVIRIKGKFKGKLLCPKRVINVTLNSIQVGRK